MQTRLGSMAIREPGGNSSGLPILKRLGWPYVARGRMKKNVASDAKAADPAIPMPLSHARKRRLPSCGALELVPIAVSPILLLLFCGFHLLDRNLLVRPEDLVLHVFKALELVVPH